MCAHMKTGMWGIQESVRSPETGLIGCSYGCWEPSSCILTMEPSLHTYISTWKETKDSHVLISKSRTFVLKWWGRLSEMIVYLDTSNGKYGHGFSHHYGQALGRNKWGVCYGSQFEGWVDHGVGVYHGRSHFVCSQESERDECWGCSVKPLQGHPQIQSEVCFHGEFRAHQVNYED